MTVCLFEVATGLPIGSITDEQFEFMQDHLEEESADDDDYYLNRATLDLFEAERGDPALVSLLRSAMGSRDDIDIRWQREEDRADGEPS